MKTINKEYKIVPLSNDIKHIAKTINQGTFELMKFSRNHSEPYLLVDKKPVWEDLTQDELIGIFENGDNHYCLSSEQIFRFGMYCNLPEFNIIALLLKGEWEIHLSESLGNILDLSVKLKNKFTDRNLVNKYFWSFKPNKDNIYKLIQYLPEIRASSKVRSNINLLIEDMTREGCFLLNNHRIKDYYPEEDYNETRLLKNSSIEIAKEYNKLKYLWRQRKTELEEKLYSLEKSRKLSINITDSYYRKFGPLELKKMNLVYQIAKYKTVLKLKKADSNLTFKQALLKAFDYLSDLEKRGREMQQTYTRSLNCLGGFATEGSAPILEDQIQNYEKSTKILLNKLYFLLHSDTCPVQNRSKEQESGINELWLELMSTKDEIYSYTPGMLMWSLPDYDRLLSILIRACKILDINRNDLDVSDPLDLMIKKGTPLEKIISFLKHDIENLQLHLTNLEIIQDDYTSQKQTQQYGKALEDFQNHKINLENEVKISEKTDQKLREEIKLAFKKVVAEDLNA